MGKIADYLGAPMRILLVEDDPDAAADFVRAVDPAADDLFLVSRTANAGDLVKILGEMAVDLVVLDETPGNRTWQQVAREILKASPSMRIVLHSESPSQRLLDECVRNGVRRPLRKRLPTERLVEELESLVEDERRLRTRYVDAPGELPGHGAGTPGWDPGTPRMRGQGHLIVVASGFAGGAGKTTLAANLAVWVANHPAFPRRVALLDLEKGRGSMRSLFDPNAPPKPSILDLRPWAGYDQVPPETLASLFPRDSVALRRFHVALMYGSGDYRADDQVTPELVRTVLTSLRLSFEVVVVDLPGDVTDVAVAAMQRATTGLWLVRSDMRDFDRHADVLAMLRGQARLDLTRFSALLTMVPKSGPLYKPEQISHALKLPVLPWALPYDPQVAAMLPGHFPAIEHRNGPYMTGLKRVVEEIMPEMRGGAEPARRRGFLAAFSGRRT